MNGFAIGFFTGLLSVSVIAISPGFDVQEVARRRATPDEEKLEQVFHLDVFEKNAMGERSNVDSREVQIVRNLLEPVLTRVAEPEECLRAVRAVLTASFANRVTFDETEFGYKAIWNAEKHRFDIICCESTAVDVDVDGTLVRVPMEVGTFLD